MSAAATAPGFAAIPRPIGLRQILRAEPLATFGVGLLVLLLTFAATIAWLGLPLYSMRVHSGVSVKSTYASLFALVLFLFGSMAVATLCRYLRARLLDAVVERLDRRIEERCIVIALDLGRRGLGSKAGLLLQDQAEVSRFLAGGGLAHLLDLLAVPLFIGFIWLVHPYYVWLAIVGALALTLFGWVTERQGRRRLAAASALAGEASSRLSRQLQRRDELEGFGLLPAILRRWQPLQLKALALREAALRRSSALISMMNGFSMLFRSAVMLLSAYLIISEEVAPGVWLAAMFTSMAIISPFESLTSQWVEWAHARASYDRLRTSLAIPPAPPPGDPPETDQPGLAIAGLRLTVPDRAAPLVEELTLDIAPGAVVALTGANGAGKSTLLRTLVGPEPPAAGRVCLDGRDLHQTARGEIGPAIGFLGQRNQLLEASILDNIGRCTGDTAGAVAAARLAGAHEMIGRLPQGYATHAGVASGLSGGQQRQIALARALFGAPALLALDEPEAGLDPAGVAALQAAIAEAARRGAVVLLATHALAPWRGMVDAELHLSGDGRWTFRRFADA